MIIVPAIVATIAAAVWTFTVIFANSMASSPQPFRGGGTVIAAWSGVALLWLVWWFG